MSSDRLAYNRLETDREFQARIKEKHPGSYLGYEYGTALDDLAWRFYKMQRRIVFVPA